MYMDDQLKKCSSKKHSDIDAISYCNNCKKYFCGKCLTFHFDLFENHKLTDIDKTIDESFFDICANHKIHFEFFCKNHNQLCCSSCICKIKNELYGQHTDCDVYPLNEIKEEKRIQLEKNINILEDLSKNIDNLIKKFKISIDKINANKDEIKMRIQGIFSIIKKMLNEKEEKLLNEVDKKYDKILIKDDVLENAEKLPKKVKLTLQMGNSIKQDLKINNINSFINDCSLIDNKMKEINNIRDDIKKSYLNKKRKIKYNLDVNQINQIANFILKIDSLGKIEMDEDFYDNYKIETKNPIFTLKAHTDSILCLTLLEDGRLASGAQDYLIIIYNRQTFQPEIKINEHKGEICCLCQLSSGLLASCSDDKTIKLFSIKENEYKIIQCLNYHKKKIYKIIELTNNKLVSCSSDSSVIFYSKNNANSQYTLDYRIKTNSSCSSVIQTKNNEICFSECNENKISFFDFSEKKPKGFLSNIDKRNHIDEWLFMLNELYLGVPGKNQISIINVDQYKLIRIIEINDSNWIFGSCVINNNILFTGDRNKDIIQWKIEEDNLIFISKKENAHDDDINTLVYLENEHFASGSNGGIIKIW